MVTCLHPGYSLTLTLQMIHLVIDIFFNASTVIIGTRNTIVQLVFYILQDVGIVFAAIIIFLTFFETHAFKAGFLCVLMRKFSASLVVTGIYLLFTVAFQTWSIYLRFGLSYTYIWNEGLQALYVVQKVLAVFYYYCYKRAAMRLGNRKYYEDSEWLRGLLNAT